MPLRMCVLASGSDGNCIYVASACTRVLIDAGLSGRATQKRLATVAIDPAGLQAVCVTHAHADHRAGVPALQQRFGLKLYANAGTIDVIDHAESGKRLTWEVFTTGVPFTVGDLRLEPFAVPHDCCDPVGFVVSDGTSRIGLVTDMGMPTSLVRERLKGCHALVMESNHDEEMLRNSKRPWVLKQRILGRQGHLSNTQAADLLAEIASPQLRFVFLAHISNDCNRPEVAVTVARRALERAGHGHVDVKLTYADRASDFVDL